MSKVRISLCEQYRDVGFSPYGLDAAWRGRRWLGPLGATATGGVEHASLGHGDTPRRRPDEAPPHRFVTVITAPARPRRSCEGGYLEATSQHSAAAIAGVGLIRDSWPWQLDHDLRQDWIRQQTDLACELADQLDSNAWSAIALPVNELSTKLRYRESEYGWVIAGEISGVFLGAYGRGVSAFGLGLTLIHDLGAYQDRG